jgi:hypothetical protein
MLTVQQSLELPTPSQWPMDMARFGKNPEGGNLYRVVFAPSVKKLVFGEFSDGYVGAKVRPMYRELGNTWILEKWLSGFEDTKLTPAEYERYGPRDPQSNMLINGPYPYKGTYNFCWDFKSDSPSLGEVEKAIGLIRKGEGKSVSEIRAQNREIDHKQEEQAKAERFMRVREKEPLYGVRPASFAGNPKRNNHKSQRTEISANELAKMNFPYKRGSIVSMRGPKVELNGSL